MTRKKQTFAVFLLFCSASSFIWADPDMDIPLVESPLTGELLDGQFPTETLTGEESTSSANDSPPMSQIVSDLTTGEVFVPTPRLVISEVFFDGSDERFEIANIGSGSFSGELIVQGVKSTDLHLFTTLPSGAVFVRGDTMSQILNKQIIYGSGLGLSISDTLALNVNLIISGQISDTFSVPAISISTLPNLYGFEKIRSGGELLITSTSTGRVVNISGSWIANPGHIYTAQLPSAEPIPTASGTSNPPISTGNTEIPLSANPSCGAKIQNTSPFYVGNSVNLIATASGTDIQNSSARYSCERSIASGSSFTGCNPSYFAFSGAGIYRAMVHITSTDGQICQAETWINYPAKTLSTASSEDIALAESIEPMSFGTTQIRIVSLLPDAEGKDENNEQITIELLSGENVDLQDFIVHINSKKTALHGLLSSPGARQTFKSTFGMVNKPACVTLERGGLIFDRFCYGQPKAGVLITQTGDFSAEPGLSGLLDFSRVKELRIGLFTGEACSIFGETLFDCVAIKPLLDEKKKASYEKKLLSLQKKYDKKQQQYTGLQERYKKTKTELDAKRRKYYQQVKTVRNTYKSKLASSDLEKKIRKNYGKILGSHLKKDRYVVRQNSDIAFIAGLLDANIAALKENDPDAVVHIDGQTFKLGDIQKQYQYATDPALRVDMLVEDLLEHIDTGFANRRTIRLEQRYPDNNY